METVKKVAGQVMRRLQESSPRTSELMLQNNELSIYDGTLSTPIIIKNIARIKNSFPALPEGFYEVFSQRIVEQKFNDARLSDAVNHVIDTCIYPTPTIAQFISFDKKIKIYKYFEIMKMVDDGDPKAFERHKRIVMDGLPEPVWIHINDIAKYNII